jgi:hypothetical protein
MEEDTFSQGQAKWLGLPVITTVARILCKELALQNEYLHTENKILKAKIAGRIRFTDDERRSLVHGALAMGRQLTGSAVSIVTPATREVIWGLNGHGLRRPRLCPHILG